MSKNELVKRMMEEAERELNIEYHDELTDSEYEQYVRECKKKTEVIKGIYKKNSLKM